MVTIRGSARATALRVAPLMALVLLMALLQGLDGQGHPTLWGYVCLGMAGAMLIPIVFNLFWPPTLELRHDAFVCRWLWSTTMIPWESIQTLNVAISRAGTRSRIGLDYRSDASLTPAQQRARGAAQTVNLCDWAIPNLWDASTPDMVRRLNDELAHRVSARENAPRPV